MSQSHSTTTVAGHKIDTWNPAVYGGRFVEERTRPGLELLERARYAASLNKRTIQIGYDLGTGTGRFIPHILEAFPSITKLIATDTSDTMLKQATEYIQSYNKQSQQPTSSTAITTADILNKVSFRNEDISLFNAAIDAGGPADLVYSNAVLQWVPNHETLLPHILSQLSSGGILAIQVPYDFHKKDHTLMYDVSLEHEESGKIAKGTTISLHRRSAQVSLKKDSSNLPSHQLSDDDESRLPLQYYYHLLLPNTSYLDIWETTYLQTATCPITDPPSHPVAHFLHGSSLAAFLAHYPKEHRDTFLKEYVKKLEEAYPTWKRPVAVVDEQTGTKTNTSITPREELVCIFPFSRWFVVAVKK